MSEIRHNPNLAIRSMDNMDLMAVPYSAYSDRGHLHVVMSTKTFPNGPRIELERISLDKAPHFFWCGGRTPGIGFRPTWRVP